MAITAAPTFQDFFDIGKAEAQDRRPDLAFDEGDVSEMFMAQAAAMADHLVGYIAQRVKDTYLDGAAGDALTILADDRYNIQRQEAAEAVGVLTLTRSSGTLTGTIPAGTVFATNKDSAGNDIQFLLLEDSSWGSGVLTKDENAAAILVGTGGNVAANTIVNVVTGSLFDTFTVNNADRFAGGSDEESDESLRERCRTFPTTLRRGTLTALEYGAKTVAGVVSATADDSANDGTVNVYIADVDGGSNSTLEANVATELENWRAAGIPVNVIGGELYNITIALSLTVRTGVDSAAIASDIKKAIVARINKLKIGESCSQALIQQAAMNVDPDGILNVTVTTPVGTVVPSANQLIRTTTGDITVS